MKKSYLKPIINFDSFEISSAFAATCGKSGEYNIEDCSVIIAGTPCFVKGIAACKFEVTDGYSDICYYTPTADNTLFGS